MRSLQEIERAIEQLSAAEVAELRRWMARAESSRWDVEVEEDVGAGVQQARRPGDEELEDLDAMFSDLRRLPR